MGKAKEILNKFHGKDEAMSKEEKAFEDKVDKIAMDLAIKEIMKNPKKFIREIRSFSKSKPLTKEITFFSVVDVSKELARKNISLDEI